MHLKVAKYAYTENGFFERKMSIIRARLLSDFFIFENGIRQHKFLLLHIDTKVFCFRVVLLEKCSKSGFSHFLKRSQFVLGFWPSTNSANGIIGQRKCSTIFWSWFRASPNCEGGTWSSKVHHFFYVSVKFDDEMIQPEF